MDREAKKRVMLKVRQIINSVPSKSRNSELKDPIKYFIIISGEVLWTECRDISIYKNNEGYRRHLVCTVSQYSVCVCVSVCAVEHPNNTQERGEGLCDCQFGNYYALIQTIIINNPNYWQQKYSKPALNFQQQNSQLLLGEMGSWSRSPKIHLRQLSNCWGKWKQNCSLLCKPQNISNSRTERANGLTLLCTLPSRSALWETEFLTSCLRMMVSQAGTHHGLAAERLNFSLPSRIILWSLCNH